MFFSGERKVPALLKARVTANDSISLSLQKGMQVGYMVKNEFDGELGKIACKIFPTESSAKAYAKDQEVIKVNVSWQP